MSLEREVGALEARMAKVESEILAMSADVREIRDAIVTARGGWKTLSVVIGLSASVGALIGKIVPFLVLPQP